MGPRRCWWQWRELSHVGLILTRLFRENFPTSSFIVKKPRARNAERQFGHGSILGGSKCRKSNLYGSIFSASRYTMPVGWSMTTFRLQKAPTQRTIKAALPDNKKNDEKEGLATDSEGIRAFCRKMRLVSQQKKEKKSKNDTWLINPLYLCIVKRTETDNIFSLDI